MPENRIAKLYKKPLALFLIIISLVFLVEFLLMEFLIARIELTGNKLVLVDTVVLPLILTPVLYFFFFRPLRRLIRSLRQANDEINRLKYDIEKSQELGRVGTWNLDLERDELTWTDEVYRIFGIPVGTRLTYTDFIERVHPEDREKVELNWQAALNGEEYDIEHRVNVNGQVRWVREKAELLFSENGEAAQAVGFIQDITELKMLEEKAVRSAQLATAGELTTMIAHEVNNPLSGVIGYAQVFSNKACPDCANTELLERIIREGDRISKILKGLLDFSYNASSEKTERNLGPIILDALNLVKNQIEKKGIRLEVAVSESLPPVTCNPHQLQQVILNIVRNAFQAVSSGVLENESEGMIRIHALDIENNGRRYAEIRIVNNGPNIPPDLLDRIREPFFTTKPIGAGTGLGLSISSDILHEHDGYLDISSDPGCYTEMILGLPLDNHLQAPGTRSTSRPGEENASRPVQ